MASVGVMFVMNGLTRLIIGVDDQRFDDGARFIINVRDFREWSGLTEGLALRSTQALTVIVTVIVCAALFWFLNRTKSGKAMRAYSDNEDLALLSALETEERASAFGLPRSVIHSMVWTLMEGVEPIARKRWLLAQTFGRASGRFYDRGVAKGATDEDGDVRRPENPAARYAVTKGVVDAKCFRPMRLTILFDGRRRELESSVEGGEVVDEAAWEAARAGRQTPPEA